MHTRRVVGAMHTQTCGDGSCFGMRILLQSFDCLPCSWHAQWMEPFKTALAHMKEQRAARKRTRDFMYVQHLLQWSAHVHRECGELPYSRAQAARERELEAKVRARAAPGGMKRSGASHACRPARAPGNTRWGCTAARRLRAWHVQRVRAVLTPAFISVAQGMSMVYYRRRQAAMWEQHHRARRADTAARYRV